MSTQTIGSGTMRRLRTLFEERYDIMIQLAAQPTFCIDDVDAPDDAYMSVVNTLKGIPVIRPSGKEIPRDERPDADDTITVWEWHRVAFERLQTYREDRTTFEDCPHRAHVHHTETGFGCQYCDQPRDIDREEVEEKVFGQ
ncbi:hypothetical protein [Haloarcula sp. JP-L23]|uniref:hypothetical protein n=1 Tax=Haloarcula sp. JP-L23 TaxID=2716717 RepID=UPI00140F0C1F|nr:hypothetical protein G9465_25015 [Haloarcula sp. JP-L23]